VAPSTYTFNRKGDRITSRQVLLPVGREPHPLDTPRQADNETMTGLAAPWDTGASDGTGGLEAKPIAIRTGLV
jgi:hypothetical protein